MAIGVNAQQLWDVQLNANPVTAGGTATAGVYWTGTEFWMAQWNSAVIFTADAAGAPTGQFTIAGITGARSFTTDGTSVFVGAATGQIFEVDPVTKTLTSTINTAVPVVRYVTYDPNLNSGAGGFWAGDFNTDITAVDMTGTTLSTIAAATHGLMGIYGMSWDNSMSTGPHLWAYHQGGSQSVLAQLTMTGAQTGITKDVNDQFGATGIAGGAFVTTSYVPGTTSLIIMNQGANLVSYVVQDPPMNEAGITILDLQPYEAVGANNVLIRVENNGLNTITAIDVKYDDGSNVYTDNVTGLNIPSWNTGDITHATPANVVAAGANNFKVWIELSGDMNQNNDSIERSVFGLTTVPTKTIVAEEKTGTWCQWCPRGAVGMSSIESDPEYIGIAVHNGANNPMTLASYDGAIGTYVPGGYPGGGIDRIIGLDPSQFQATGPLAKSINSPAVVNSATATATQRSATNWEINVESEVEFFGAVPGSYRMSLVIVQDDLIGGASTGWAQVNAYGAGGAGVLIDPVSNFNWSTAGSPVAATAFGGHDHVGRALSSNNILGDAGSLPSPMTAGTHSHTFATVNTNAFPGVTDAPFVLAKSHAIIMVVNQANGQIMNAKKVSISNTVGIEDVEGLVSFKSYPNPANSELNIEFALETAMNLTFEVVDVTGKTVATSAANYGSGTNTTNFNTTNWAAGMYSVNIIADGKFASSKKVIVQH